MTPWHENQELTRDRLIQIATKLRDIRDDTVLMMGDADGVSSWSIGCTAYDRQINLVEEWAEEIPWLDVVVDGKYFLMKIGECPVRIYRGDPEKPTKRTLKIKEHEQQMLLFPCPADNLYWRMVTQTHPDQSTAQISLCHYTSSGDQLGQWDIPLDEKVFAPIPKQIETVPAEESPTPVLRLKTISI